MPGHDEGGAGGGQLREDSFGRTASGGKASGGASSGGEASGSRSSGGSGAGVKVGEPAELGASCEESSDCESGECVDGVCCESECDGVCETCNAEGRCVAADSDAACPEVSCGSGTNGCLDYGAELEGGTCKSQGVCKTKDDCPTTPKVVNTVCTLGDSMVSYCDGEGECVSSCGGSCPDSSVCCLRRSSGVFTLQCVAETSCIGTMPSADPALTPIACDEHEDCQTGYLCSLKAASGGSDTACRSATRTDVEGANHDGPYVDNYEACASPRMAERSCSNGGACQDRVYFPGWKVCSR